MSGYFSDNYNTSKVLLSCCVCMIKFMYFLSIFTRDRQLLNFYIVSKIEWVIWIHYGHRLTTVLLLLWILVIYQVLSVSFLCNNIPDTLFLSPPRNFWKCTGSSHIMVSLECVQWDKFKVSLKTGFLWVFWQ